MKDPNSTETATVILQEVSGILPAAVNWWNNKHRWRTKKHVAIKYSRVKDASA